MCHTFGCSTEAGRGLGLNIACLGLPHGGKGIFVQKVHSDSAAEHSRSIW